MEKLLNKMYAKEMVERVENGEDPLELSIEKWVDIVDCFENAETDSDCTGLENSSSNCALCFTHPDCDNCPVYLFTGIIGCADTPYVKFISTYGISEKKRIAKKELEFLKLLRSYED